MLAKKIPETTDDHNKAAGVMVPRKRHLQPAMILPGRNKNSCNNTGGRNERTPGKFHENADGLTDGGSRLQVVDT